MKEISIFDSLTHPTLSGRFLGKAYENTFENLVQDMKSANFTGGCAVGLAGMDGYEHESFAQECAKYQNLIPIAGFYPAVASIRQELHRIVDLGFQGIKIHPRFSDIDLERDRPLLIESLVGAAEFDLTVFLCTYSHGTIEKYPEVDPFYSLVKLLKDCPDSRVVLVHGGDVQLLRYAELVRFNQSLLLDLSLTILKYEGSSLDADLQFLFRSFDQRICIGTDHPEYTHKQLRERFNTLSAGVDEEKLKNIAHRNILRFLGLEQSPVFQGLYHAG